MKKKSFGAWCSERDPGQALIDEAGKADMTKKMYSKWKELARKCLNKRRRIDIHQWFNEWNHVEKQFYGQ